VKPYKPKSLAGAARKVRQLQRAADQLRSELNDLRRYLVREQHTSRLLARLAATGPAFTNPIIAWEAQARRDQILAELGLNPDGSPMTPIGKRPDGTETKSIG
jgi:ATPase subunit of ABC transporter with duplicated ATPase domains